MVTGQQVRRLRQKLMQGKTQEAAAAAAGMSVRSAGKWQRGLLPAERRTTRLRRASKLAPGKTWDTFQHRRLPARLQQQLGELAQGEFIEQGTNVLAFGLPGTGKTHALCALGHRLVETGYSVLFTPAYRLVQELLAAQRDLQLPRALRKLDNFDFLVLDDLGYLPQGAAESEVLFTLMAERYERRAIGITSNLVFSQWDQIFQNPMATAAAIDRVVRWAARIVDVDHCRLVAPGTAPLGASRRPVYK